MRALLIFILYVSSLGVLHCHPDPTELSEDVLQGLSRDGERYVDEEMKRALFGVKRMKEVMEKNQEKHEHFMKTLKESSDKRKGAVQLATEAELKLQKAEEQCRDSLRTSFMECRPCLEDTCKTFYTSTCRRGFSSFSFKVEEFFKTLSSQLETPDQVVNQNQDNLNQTQNSEDPDPDLELVRLNASFSQMQGKMSSLHNRSTELVNKMHQEFGHGFWVAFTTKLKPKPLSPTQESPSGGFFMGMCRLGSMGLDDVLEEVYDFGRAVVEDFSNAMTDVLDEIQEAVDEESWQQRDTESFPSWSWIPVPFPDMYLCRQLRRQAAECWQLQRLCESCQDTLVKECPSVRELHSVLEETYLLLNASHLQYEEMLQVVQKHTEDTHTWLNNMEAKYGWVTQLTNGTLGPQYIFGVSAVVLKVRDNGFKGDTRVVLNILDSPSLTLSVPAELEVQDSAFIQYVAQEALAHYKQSKDNVITFLESRGLVVHPDHPWLGASPDGILDATQLLEIKWPFKSFTSLTEFLSRPSGDIKSLDDGQYLICPNGKDGSYLQTQVTMMCLGLQSCKVVVWTPSEHIEVDIPFDKDYTDGHVQQLQNFLHMLPRLADDFAEKKIHLYPKYLELYK